MSSLEAVRERYDPRKSKDGNHLGEQLQHHRIAIASQRDMNLYPAISRRRFLVNASTTAAVGGFAASGRPIDVNQNNPSRPPEPGKQGAAVTDSWSFGTG